MHNDPGAGAGLWNNAYSWTGNFPLGGAMDSGGPANGILFRTANGQITNYAVYNGDGTIVQRVDLVGASHGGVDTPHIQDYSYNENPATGKIYPSQNRVAVSATADDMPPAGFNPAGASEYCP